MSPKKLVILTKVIVLDDVPPDADRVVNLLQERYGSVVMVEKACNPAEVAKVIGSASADVLYLIDKMWDPATGLDGLGIFAKLRMILGREGYLVILTSSTHAEEQGEGVDSLAIPKDVLWGAENTPDWRRFDEALSSIGVYLPPNP